jgi:bifunctional enzyme CysN/CysC
MAPLLRFLTCGSVDDGKSTLIGRLLRDSHAVFDDHMAALERDSRRHGTTGTEPDLALLLDGLEEERQQGITIDVAWRYFSTPRRSFIVADTPGHEQYTRNMATGASHAQLAVLLVDARQGLLTQTRRHSHICSLLGIRDIVLAINKIDLVGFNGAVFARIAAEYEGFAKDLGFRSIVPVPISARHGDNVVTRSDRMPWYQGPTLLHHLETVDAGAEPRDTPFRFPVAWVNRPDAEFRGFAGTVASGRIAVGEEIVVAASGQRRRVARILSPDGDTDSADAGEAITLTLQDAVDIARGDVLAPPDQCPAMADQFAAHLLWMDSEPLLPGRQYQLRIGHLWTLASVTSIRHRLDANTMEHQAARRLELNEIGFCNLASATRLPLDPYEENRETGAFILVDRMSNRTAGAGMVRFPLRRAANIHREHFSVDKAARSRLLGQKPVVLWLTGLSGSGKSTIARLLEQLLHDAGRLTFSLDGDNLRHGLNRDLGFTDADRVENIRRVGEIAKLFVEAGTIVICSFISPFRAERQAVRELLEPGEFIEIFVDTPIEECMRRDPKGLYAKARSGAIRNFTGIDSPYEPPAEPEMHLRTPEGSAEVLAAEIFARVMRNGG